MSGKVDRFRDESEKIQESIRMQCSTSAGSMDTNFLCASISLLDPPEPLQMNELESLDSAMKLLQTSKLGCLTVVNDADQLVGIFSERDYTTKIYGKDIDHSTPVKEFMTPNPVVIALDETIAYALTLMSHGGFRHLPVVDQAKQPIGILSVKNIVDHLAEKVLNDLLELSI